MAHLLSSNPPPRWARLVGATLLRPGDWSTLEGDLNEEYMRRATAGDVSGARRWYVLEVARAVPHLAPLQLATREARLHLLYPPIVIAAIAIAAAMQRILWHSAAYRDLYRHHPWVVPEFFKNSLGVLVCVLAISVIVRLPPREIAAELRLAGPIVPALAFALAVSFPMLTGIALTHGFSSPPLPYLLFLTLFSPLTYQVVSSGFAVGQLSFRARWPLWAAIAVAAFVAGLQRIDEGATPAQTATIFVLAGTGCVVFAWLFVQWNNLWIPIWLHVCMNLWWELFRAPHAALGGWYPLALQSLTMTLAIAATIYLRRRNPRLFHRCRQVRDPGRPDRTELATPRALRGAASFG